MRLLTLVLASSALLACNKDQPPAREPVAKSSAAKTPVKITGPISKAYVEPVIGGAVMAAGKDIMSNLSASSEHTKFVAAVKAAGLLETLQGRGPFTIFAPTDAAFAALPSGRFDTLMKPESRDDLATLIAYHIVPGLLDAEALQALILAGGGSTKLKTVEGTKITASAGNGEATITDAKHQSARVNFPNVLQVNGVVHVIDRVLQPQ